jgi:uncharacterized protein YacL
VVFDEKKSCNDKTKKMYITAGTIVGMSIGTILSLRISTYENPFWNTVFFAMEIFLLVFYFFQSRTFAPDKNSDYDICDNILFKIPQHI